MRILLISSSYNGLCQRAHIELDNLGHDISITLALSAEDIRQAVALFQPDLIICPFLKEKIPEDVYKNHLCIILHPGIKGDRGIAVYPARAYYQSDAQFRHGPRHRLAAKPGG